MPTVAVPRLKGEIGSVRTVVVLRVTVIARANAHMIKSATAAATRVGRMGA